MNPAKTDHDFLIQHGEQLVHICETLTKLEEHNNKAHEQIEFKIDKLCHNFNLRVRDCLVEFEDRPRFSKLENLEEAINKRPTRKELYSIITIVCAVIAVLVTLL